MKKILFLISFIILSIAVNATVWTVNNVNNSGNGSLRTAIFFAGAGDTIQFNPNLISNGSDSILLTSSIDFSASLTIKGLYTTTDTLFISGGGTNRVFEITSTTNVTLDSLVLVDGYNVYTYNNNGAGGAITCIGIDSLFILNSVIKNNYARKGAGVYSYNVDYCLVKGSKILYNEANSGGSTTGGYGGGVFCGFYQSLGVLDVKNSFIQYNNSSSIGSGIVTSGVDVFIDSCYFSNNINTAVQIKCDGVDSDIRNSQFINNGGRGITVASLNTNNDTARFTNVEVSGCVGGISAGMKNVFLDNCQINNNAAGNGGGANISAKKLHIIDCTFSNNSSAGIGGGLFTSGFNGPLYSVQIINSRFYNNQASTGGGGFASQTFSSTAYIYMLNTEIDSNQATFGGGIFFEPWGSGYLTMDSCVVTNNTANGSVGGGIKCRGNVSLNNSLVAHNNGNNGGGIHYSDAFQSLNLDNSTIELNTAAYSGGGIFAYTNYSSAKVNLYQSTISENYANKNGGGICFKAESSTSASMETLLLSDESSIVLNVADSAGGGVYASAEATYGSAMARMFIFNSTIARNSSGLNGSGIYAYANSSNSGEFTVIYLQSSIIGLNSGGVNISNNLLPFMYSHGYNIFSDTTLLDTVSTDQLGVDSTMLNLSTLSSNGGATKTIMPLPPSVAIDSGHPTDTIDAQNVPIVGVRDVGAAEVCFATNATDTIIGCTSYTWIDGVTYYSSNNTAIHTLVNAMGCDSIVTLNLTLNSTYSIDTLYACDSLTWIDGITYTSSNNTATDTLVNSIGCDSIVTLNLTILNPTFFIDTVATCDSLTWINGITYYSSNNTATDTLVNSVGCDSIVTLNLTISNLNTNYTYVDNGSGNFSFTNSSTGNYTNSHWAFGDGVTSLTTNSTHTYSANGTYVVVLAIHDSNVVGDSCISYFTDTIFVTGAINPTQCNAGWVVFTDSTTGGVTIVNSSTGTNLSYHWEFGDGDTSNLQFPSHTYAANGPYNLCLTINDGNGCSDTYCDSISSNGVLFKNGFDLNVVANYPLGVQSLGQKPEVKIYPNPTSSTLNIEAQNFKITKILIRDNSGKVVKTITSNFDVVNVENLATGVYHLELIGGSETVSKKFIKQ